MKTNCQDDSRSGQRRRWLGAIAAGAAGVFAWTLGKRRSSEKPATLAAAAPVPSTPVVASRASKIVVKPAAGAVKRHG